MEDNDTPQKRKAHLTRDQRMTIEAMLNKGLSFHEIAKAVNVHHSTISREVKSRRREENIGARGMTLNRCIHRTQCDKRQICMDRPDCLLLSMQYSLPQVRRGTVYSSSEGSLCL